MLGQVTDRTTSAPVSGAIVSLNGYQTAITDSSGNYSFGAWGTMTFVEADNYATDYRYIRGTPHNVHLYPIKRITAGVMTLEALSTTNGPPRFSRWKLLLVDLHASRTPPRFRSPPERRLWHRWKCPSVRTPANRSP